MSAAFRLGVSLVGGSEQAHGAARHRLDDPSRRVDLQLDKAGGQVGDVRVREGMISDVVAFSDHAARNIGMVGHPAAKDEEAGADVLVPEDVKDRRGPSGSGPSSKVSATLPGASPKRSMT